MTTTTIIEDPARDARLKAWISTITQGGTVTAVERVGGGAFRASARVQIANGSEPEIFLKIDLGSAPPTGYDLEREYELLCQLDGMAVRAPRVLGFDKDVGVMAMACLPGEARYAMIGDDAELRERVEQSFVEALVEVHRLDVNALALDYLPTAPTITQAIAFDIESWRTLLFKGVAEPDAVTLFAFAWLTARLPQTDDPAVLVQGDAGPGNFLFDAQGVTGLVDWEMAHFGHPLEDLGCVLARSLVQPMIASDRLSALYASASGTTYDRNDLIYATVLLMTRFNVPILLALESRNTALDYGLTSSYFRLSQISMLTLIAQAEGIATHDVVVTGPTPSVTFELEYLASMLKHVIRPELSNDYSRYRLDGATALVDYVGKVAALDTDDHPIKDVDDRYAHFERVVASGHASIELVLKELLGEARHREKLMTGMLGPLAGHRVEI